MTPQLELVKLWLDRAKVDLRSAEVDLSVDPPIVEDACFHCQQAVEKILRGYLVFQEVEFEKTHSIGSLLRLCMEKEKSFEILKASAVDLTKYAAWLRYPFLDPAPTSDQARNYLDVARKVWQFTVAFLPAEVIP